MSSASTANPRTSVQEKGSLRNLVVGNLLTLLILGITLIVFIAAPILALRWSTRPFPGFMVEQTLVVSGVGGVYWNAQRIGINYPERVTQIGEKPVRTLQEYDAALSGLEVGQPIQVHTVFPDGSKRVYPSVRLSAFSWRDLLSLFWLPYLVGLAYLLIGLWIYRMRGSTITGRVFVVFCAFAALTTGLLFDLTTTHAVSALWTVSIASIGGSLIGLSLVFPQEWSLLRRYDWLRFFPYAISLALGIWGISILYNQKNPWAYVNAWRLSYIYAGVSILFFIGVMLYRQHTGRLEITRQQARVILWGSLFAFLPVAGWLIGSQFGLPVLWNPILFVPSLILFPATVALAILRYRLWDIDLLINRTLVYGLLTVLLALVYVVMIIFTRQAFRLLIGSETDFAAAISTLAIAALFNPLRNTVQEFIDQRFYRRKYDAAKTLEVFSSNLQEEVDLDRVVSRLETVIWETIMPAHTLTWLQSSEGYRLYQPDQRSFGALGGRFGVDTVIDSQDALIQFLRQRHSAVDLDDIAIRSAGLEYLMRGGVAMVIPLFTNGKLLGWISLGSRLSGQEYTSVDRDLLTRLAAQAAPALRIAYLVAEQQAEALLKERLEQELSVARRIQNALLPNTLPDLKGWRTATFYQPARAVGGDFFDFVTFADGRLGILIGDVTDKGISAALVMATTRTLLKAVITPELAPGQVLERVNNLLHADIPPNMFVTCLYAILDPADGSIVFANAGHNLPYCRSNQGVTELRATGMPLGLLSDMKYEDCQAQINPSDCVFFYTDGLVEAHDPDREMFGSRRLQELLIQTADDGETLINRMWAELNHFVGPEWEQEDDITIIVIKRISPPLDLIMSTIQ